MSEPVRRTVRVACSVDHAFDVFTTRIDQWWPASHRRFERSRVAIERAVGGRFVERASNGDEATLGHVLRWEPPFHLRYSWFPGADAGPTQVDVRFIPDDAHTVVEVHHAEGESGLGVAWPARAERFARAWDAVLACFTDLAGSPANR